MDCRQSSAKDCKFSRKVAFCLNSPSRIFVSEIGNLFGELGDGLFPVDLVGLRVLEEEFEDLDELFRGGDGVVEDDAIAW